MVKRPLTRGWSITSEPLTLGKVRISARRRLATYHFPRVSFRQQVMIGLTHVEKIQNWLYVIGAGTSAQQQRRDIPRFLVDDVSW